MGETYYTAAIVPIPADLRAYLGTKSVADMSFEPINWDRIRFLSHWAGGIEGWNDVGYRRCEMTNITLLALYGLVSR